MKKLILSTVMLLLMAVTLQAQTITVHGTVVSSSDGDPLIGASVISEASTANGVATDLDGNFTITVPDGSSLIFSYVGYQSRTIKAEQMMQVTLDEDSEMLDEVVVVGYQTMKKADLTGSVSVVSTKALETSSDTDPMRALQGKVPGMTVTANGSPSGTGTVRIRGIGSFNASQEPLFVIDGVPTTASLNSLNMNDIESMQVLKDAASASIYGSRAANGVIIITTKKGKAADKKVNVSFSANLTAQFYSSQSKMKLLDTPGYATAMAQAALNDGIDPVTYASSYGLNLNAASGYPISVYNIATGQYQNYTVNGLYDGYINARQTMPMSNTDWLDEISRTGFTQSYDVAVSSAGEKSNVLFSLGYRRAEGILKHTNFENISARVNSSFDISKVVSVGENFTLTYTDQVDCQPLENALKMPSVVPVFETDGVTYAGPVGSMPNRQNPMRELAFNKDNALKIWRLFGNAFIDIKPIKGLTLRSNFGLDYDAAFIHSYNYTYHSDIVNNDTNSTTLSQANDSKWTWTNTANYNFAIGADHNFTALAGFELYRQNRIDFSGINEDYDIETPDYMYPDASSGVERSTGNKSAYSLVSFFGKIDYNWRNRALASFTIRHDGSSRFGSNNRYGTFPAATLGYRLSEDLKKTWMDELKIRLSWGKTGNQAISNTARYGLYVADYGSDRVTSTAYDLLLQQSGIFPSGYYASQTANPDLKWETTIQYNAGVDFGFLRNRLTGSVDAYIKDVKDMLINPAYLGAMGEGGASWLNGPSLRNWGMEFLVSWRDQLACGLGYRASLNLDFFRNRVTYLPATTTGSYVHTPTENLVEARKPYGSIVGYVFDGLFKSQDEVLASGQDNARVGGMRYADLNGDGRITEDDQTWIFNPVPDFSMGLNIELTYRNFDFQMFWQGVLGQDVYNNQKLQNDFWSVIDAGSNKGVRTLDAWLPVVNANSTIPMLTTNDKSDEKRTSSYFVENGSYMKLRTLQVGYNLPDKLLSKLRMTKARVYVSGQNLLTIKSGSLTCTDPENPNWAYPIATSVSFGLQVDF
ncbi:MAG: TonB-dependent receptor [Candidatus Amulumruptor caecigallinarius]|nr:TonB-dependent receptor [Candidatus Amulumruptor caecigallinarius]MCM1397742.1 TonB-dependent receptor [Candidatus Amulumruptor caecigallinarius]MCM1453177.1 TonB-dependent receptor [bacterium]